MFVINCAASSDRTRDLSHD